MKKKIYFLCLALIGPVNCLLSQNILGPGWTDGGQIISAQTDTFTPFGRVADYTIDGDISTFARPHSFRRGDLPASIRYTFDTSYDLSAFHLWNGYGIAGDSVRSFHLDLWNSQDEFVGRFSGLANSDAVTLFNYTFQDTYSNVNYVDMTINSIFSVNNVSEHREVAFTGVATVIPETSTLGLLVVVLLLALVRFRSSQKL